MSYKIKVNRMDAAFEIDNVTGKVWKSKHMATARAEAIKFAKKIGMEVAIYRVIDAPADGREGSTPPSEKVVLLIGADGLPQAPAGTKLPLGIPCKKGQPGVRVCYCANCRASRRTA